jgi:hypothetical protein
MNTSIVENYKIQDLRNVNVGIFHGAQPEGTLQLANAGSRQIKLILTDKGDQWGYVGKSGSVGPEALHMSGDGMIFQGVRYPYVELNPGEWIILKLPEANGKAFTIYPRSLCEGINCLSGSNPTSQPGFYRVSGDWQNPWPVGGGYTICSRENGCDAINPAAGTTKIEGGKDMVTDISMVDGYNHSVKMEITTEVNDGTNVLPKNVTVVANPQDCNYGIRNYGSDTSKGMIGCSNTFKDGNQKNPISWGEWSGVNKPRYIDLTYARQPGYCNFEKVPWNDCGYPCAEANRPDIQNWQGTCYAPSREYCQTVHSDNYLGGSPDYYGDKRRGLFTTYCFSHDDDNSSPELKRPYKLKFTFGDGVVGKPFSSIGCDWSKGGCDNNPAPPGNQKWYCFNNKCQLLDVPQIGLPGYDSKEECVRNSDCIKFATNWYCDNNECKFNGNVDNLQTYNICRSTGCGGDDCTEGCNPYAIPRAMCRNGKYCPGSGCCDHINPDIHPDPPKNCKISCDYSTGQFCPAGNVCPITNCCEYY